MTEVTDPMVANAMAAAAAALAAPIDNTPAGVYESHSCQTGCGRIATVVLVRLADSDVDILCDVCYLLMAATIASAIPEADQVDQLEPAPDDGTGNGSPAQTPE